MHWSWMLSLRHPFWLSGDNMLLDATPAASTHDLVVREHKRHRIRWRGRRGEHPGRGGNRRHTSGPRRVSLKQAFRHGVSFLQKIQCAIIAYW